MITAILNGEHLLCNNKSPALQVGDVAVREPAQVSDHHIPKLKHAVRNGAK